MSLLEIIENKFKQMDASVANMTMPIGPDQETCLVLDLAELQKEIKENFGMHFDFKTLFLIWKSHELERQKR